MTTAFPTAAKEEMFSSFGPWCAETCISASECEGEKPRLGVASKNPALHQGITWSNSTTALGLRGARLETRVRSRCKGKERDTETGNDEFGARYYSSRFGRWLSADWSAVPTPVPYANLTNPQTLNLYAMVADDPETFVDLNGHNPPPGGDAYNSPAGQAQWAFMTGGDPIAAMAQNTTPAPQPAPTNPDGSPKAPPTTDNKGNPIVPGVDAWKPGPGSAGGDRDTRWGPTQPVPADPSKGQGQPNASWDPNGHWDVKTGNKGETVRVLPDGTRVDHDNNPIRSSMWDSMKSITPGPIVKMGTAGIVLYLIIDEGSRLYPPRNLVPVP